MIRAFIQARMTSNRFPGKVLAPLRGQPIITHVIGRVAKVLSPDLIIVVTSCEQSDDPLAEYVRQLGVNVFRGKLNNVFERFQKCLEKYPCQYFLRICADSPMLEPRIIGDIMSHAEESFDLISNVQVRTFPPGQSVEMLSAKRFSEIDPVTLGVDEQEHITKVYYSGRYYFRIKNIDSKGWQFPLQSYAIDTIEDRKIIENAIDQGILVSASDL